MAAAIEADALLVQRVPIGQFIVTRGMLAEVWSKSPDDELIDKAGHAFTLRQERTVVQDAAFPVRQLAGVALKGLSRSLNDPTTAQKAMNSLADTRALRARAPASVRVDEAGDTGSSPTRPTSTS